MNTRNYFHAYRQVWLKTAAVILIAAVLWRFGRAVICELCSLLFGACLLAFILAPLSKLLEKKMKRTAASLIALAGALAVLTGTLLILLPALYRQCSELLLELPEAFSRLQALMEAFESRIQRQAPGFRLPKISMDGAQTDVSTAVKQTISTVSSAADTVYRLFLTVMLSYFLLSDREHILLRLELMIPRSRRKNAVQAGNILLREMRLYLRGQATIALAVGSIAALGLKLIGLQGAPLLGLLVGIFNAIPYFGPFLGGIPAVLTALSAGWEKALLAVLCLFLVQQIDGMLISPRVMGSVTGFSPAIVMLALFAGARIGSIGGMLLAMPALMAVRTLYRVFVQQGKND